MKYLVAIIATLMLIGGSASGQSWTPIGGAITAVGPAFLPAIGSTLWEQTVPIRGTVYGTVSVGWNQGWNCVGTDGDSSDAGNYPQIALVDIDQHQTIGTVQVCEQGGSGCNRPAAFDKSALFTGVVQAGDHIAIRVRHQGVGCIGGSPWPVCSNGQTCGGGMIWI